MKQVKSRMPATNNKAPDYLRVVSFQTVSFFEPKEQRQVVLLYGLAEDGILYEYTNGGWHAFPIAKT